VARIVIDQRNLTVKHRTPFTMTATLFDAFNNRYPATAEPHRYISWLTPDIWVLQSGASFGTFATPAWGTGRVIARSVGEPSTADTVRVTVVQ
jgi:hypothetical protein